MDTGKRSLKTASSQLCLLSQLCADSLPLIRLHSIEATQRGAIRPDGADQSLRFFIFSIFDGVQRSHTRIHIRAYLCPSDDAELS